MFYLALINRAGGLYGRIHSPIRMEKFPVLVIEGHIINLKKHDGHLGTQGKYRKRDPQASVFFIS